MKPQVVDWELGETALRYGDRLVQFRYISTWLARHIRAKRGQKFSLSGTFASMANGLCYAIAAQVAFLNW